MPVFASGFADDRQLTPETVKRWISSASQRIPEYIDDSCLDDFLRSRDKMYLITQAQEFLSDIEKFYSACKGIEIARSNLLGYEKHLKSQLATEQLARQALGIKLEDESATPSEDLLAFVKAAIESALDEELEYVAECHESLDAQWQWHHEGAVDKGEFSPEEIRGAIARVESAATSNRKNARAAAKDAAKYVYYEPIRNKLMSLGFVVSPRGTALGAVFPQKDWIRRGCTEPEFWRQAKTITDELMMRYCLMGDDPQSITRLLMTNVQDHDVSDALVSAVGCLCVSWTRHRASGKVVYVPILGFASVIEEPPTAQYFQKYCRHLGLPSWEPDPKVPLAVGKFIESEDLRKKREAQGRQHKLLTPIFDKKRKKTPLDESELQLDKEYKAAKEQIDAQYIREKASFEDSKADFERGSELYVNYETMIRRTNLAALGHRARTLLGLRLPARQALLSFVSFRENSSKELKITDLQSAQRGVDLWICGWHSLNCAEPAALMTASSYLGEGCDVLVCFPYEGISEAGPFRNRPKETCPWCAAVELGFRSLSSNPGGKDTSVNTGSWLTQFTRTILLEPDTCLPTGGAFDAFDDSGAIITATRTTLRGVDSVSLVHNKDLQTPAYSDPVQVTKIGRVRSMYYLLGLLDPLAVALDRDLFAHAGGKALQQLDSIGDGRDRDPGGHGSSPPPDSNRGGLGRGNGERSKSPPPDGSRGGLGRGNGETTLVLELGRRVRVQYHLYYDVVGTITKLETRSTVLYVSILVDKCYNPGTTTACMHDDTKVVMNRVVTWTSDQIARNEV
jgi:hypothetical protein